MSGFLLGGNTMTGLSGYRVPILHSRFLINAKRAKVDDWVTAERVVHRRTSDIGSRQEAIDACVSWFHRLEQRLETDLADLSAGYQAVADTLRDVHAGTMTWIEMARHRGLRYHDAT